MKIITHSKKVKEKQTKIHEENYTEINPNKTQQNSGKQNILMQPDERKSIYTEEQKYR